MKKYTKVNFYEALMVADGMKFYIKKNDDYQEIDYFTFSKWEEESKGFQDLYTDDIAHFSTAFYKLKRQAIMDLRHRILCGYVDLPYLYLPTIHFWHTRNYDMISEKNFRRFLNYIFDDYDTKMDDKYFLPMLQEMSQYLSGLIYFTIHRGVSVSIKLKNGRVFTIFERDWCRYIKESNSDKNSNFHIINGVFRTTMDKFLFSLEDIDTITFN